MIEEGKSEFEILLMRCDKVIKVPLTDSNTGETIRLDKDSSIYFGHHSCVDGGSVQEEMQEKMKNTTILIVSRASLEPVGKLNPVKHSYEIYIELSENTEPGKGQNKIVKMEIKQLHIGIQHETKVNDQIAPQKQITGAHWTNKKLAVFYQNRIEIYDDKRNIDEIYENCMIQRICLIDDYYIYCLQEATQDPI
jgi:hypothetical protein